jgi:hypothetical protein
MEKLLKIIIAIIALAVIMYCIITFAKMAGYGVASQFSN